LLLEDFLTLTHADKEEKITEGVNEKYFKILKVEIS